MRTIRVLAIGAALGLLPACANADLMSAFATIDINPVGGTFPLPFDQTIGSNTVSLQYSLGSASGSLSGTGTSSGGFAIVTYYFEVLGPSSISIPLDFTASGMATLTAPHSIANQALVTGTILGPTAMSLPGFDQSLDIAQIFYDPGTVSFGNTQLVSITANTVGSVVFEVSGAGTFSTSFDPQVAIDSSFDLPGYSLIFSPVPTSAPEPGTLALVLGGVAILALRISRRERRIVRHVPAIR